MLIIVLLKGVPARTTRVVSIGGILRREEMEIVLNPHDYKAIEAADYIKGRVGGKVVTLSMGPEQKLIPIIKPLYEYEVFGVDEQVILSDRRMAGSDTLATSYTLSLGIKKIIDRHVKAIDELIQAVDYNLESLLDKARELYSKNLLPNKIYSELKPMKDSIIKRYADGKITKEELVKELIRERELINKFIVLSGIKTTDGETGSVGPQVAEALSELLDYELPHATYVEDFDIYIDKEYVEVVRRVGYLLQKLEMKLPALLTVAHEYRPRPFGSLNQPVVRANNYRGKLFEPIKWNADDIGADYNRIGLIGSPTIVGPGVETGKLPVQKIVDKSYVFVKQTNLIEWDGKKYGPFSAGDIADSLPADLIKMLNEQGTVELFTREMLVRELFYEL